MSGFGSGISNTSGPGSTAEPSMEEILASIRRILKEDEVTRDPAAGRKPNDDSDLLVLDESMLSGADPDFTQSNKTALREAFIEAAAAPAPDGVNFSSSPAMFTAPQAGEAEEELVLFSDEPEPELVLYSDDPEEELVLETPAEPEPAVFAPPAPEEVPVFTAPEPYAYQPPEPEATMQPEPEAAMQAEPEAMMQPEPDPLAFEPEPEPAPLPETASHSIIPSPEPTPNPIETMEPPPMSTYAETSESSLLDDHLSNAISNSIGSLVRSAVPERSTPVGKPGITLEEIVREALKPELKYWLETHLPEIVERVVRSEIERVVARIKV